MNFDRFPRLKKSSDGQLSSLPRPFAAINSDIGYFRVLPKEILFVIFEKLTLPELGKMALVSELMNVQVVNWMNTKSCLQRSLRHFTPFFHPGFSYGLTPPFITKIKQLEIFLSNFPSQLDEFGVMCKRITCLTDTKKRLSFSVEAFLRVLDWHTEMIQNQMSTNQIGYLTKNWIHVMNLVQFMRMMHTLMRGWDESEFVPVIKIIVKYFRLAKGLTQILNAETLTDFTKLPLKLEMKTRLCMRGLVWDFVGDDFAHRASWVLATIKQLIGPDARQQAIFFLSVFGYACEDSGDHWEEPSEMTISQKMMFEEINNHTDWQAYVEWAPSDFHEGKNMFAVLSQVICSCMSYNKQWKDSILTDVLDQLFTVPGPWLRENIAGFLLFCSEQLIMTYIGDMIVTEDEEKLEVAARLVTDMIIMSHRFDNELSCKKGIGKVFDQLCMLGSQDLRVRFHTKIWDTVQDHLEDEDGLDILDETEVAFEILRTFGTHLMRNAYNEEREKSNGATDQNDLEVETEE